MTEKETRGFWRLEGTWGKVYRLIAYSILIGAASLMIWRNPTIDPELFVDVLLNLLLDLVLLFALFKIAARLTRRMKKP